MAKRGVSKWLSWMISLSAGLVVISFFIYMLQIYIFKREADTGFYLLQDLAFVPISVLIVTVILNELLTIHEKRDMLNRLNMIVGVFYSEVGIKLLSDLAEYNKKPEAVAEHLRVHTSWTDRDFRVATQKIEKLVSMIDSRKGDLQRLRASLITRRELLLRILENPSMFEHESFTDLMKAVFHLTDELMHRQNLSTIPDKDFEHLSGDITRVYSMLIVEWLAYMRHLKNEYPYLFSLAVRTNPFDPDAKVEFT